MCSIPYALYLGHGRGAVQEERTRRAGVTIQRTAAGLFVPVPLPGKVHTLYCTSYCTHLLSKYSYCKHTVLQKGSQFIQTSYCIHLLSKDALQRLALGVGMGMYCFLFVFCVFCCSSVFVYVYSFVNYVFSFCCCFSFVLFVRRGNGYGWHSSKRTLEGRQRGACEGGCIYVYIYIYIHMQTHVCIYIYTYILLWLYVRM